MAKTENTKMTVSLDNDSKRILRNLTRAIDRLASRKWDETGGASGVKRLSEPADDPALSDDNEDHSQEFNDLTQQYADSRQEEARKASERLGLRHPPIR